MCTLAALTRAHISWTARVQDPQARLSRLRARVGALPPALAKAAHQSTKMPAHPSFLDSCTAEPQLSSTAAVAQQLASAAMPEVSTALEPALGEECPLHGGLLRQAAARRVEGLRLGVGSTKRYGHAGLALPHSVPPLVAAHAGGAGRIMRIA